MEKKSNRHEKLEKTSGNFKAEREPPSSNELGKHYFQVLRREEKKKEFMFALSNSKKPTSRGLKLLYLGKKGLKGCIDF